MIFTLLTFGLTWAVWVPRAAGVEIGVVGQLWTWAPAVAAVLCAALTAGREGVADLGRRLVRWRVGRHWYPIVLLGPAVFALAVAGVQILLGARWADVAPTALTLSLPTLLLTLVLLTVTDGLGEEVAWRGYALPRLLDRFNPVPASLILGALWGTWHLPLVWTDGAAIEGLPVWLLYGDVGAKSLIFTWVFLRTRGSVLIAALLHGSTNLWAVSPAVEAPGDLAVATGAMAAKWLLALALFALARPPRTPTLRPEPVEGPTFRPSTGSGPG